jgi:hypothetical protein
MIQGNAGQAIFSKVLSAQAAVASCLKGIIVESPTGPRMLAKQCICMVLETEIPSSTFVDMLPKTRHS